MSLDEAVAAFVREAVGPATAAEARRRLFLAVRECAYATNAASDAAALVRQRRGNCLAKADLLQHGLHLLGYAARRVRWRYELPPDPPEVAVLTSRYDIHSAVEVLIGGDWVLVDCAHDSPLAGGRLNIADWDGIGPTVPNYAPIGPIWREGIDDAAIQAAVAEILALPRGSGQPANDYLHAFNAWLDRLRDGPAS